MYKIEEVAGVYGLYRNGTLIYIGESINFHARASQHKRDGKDFDSYNLLVKEVNTIKRKAVEMWMIADVNPEYNIQHNRSQNKISELEKQEDEELEKISGVKKKKEEVILNPFADFRIINKQGEEQNEL